MKRLSTSFVTAKAQNNGLQKSLNSIDLLTNFQMLNCMESEEQKVLSRKAIIKICHCTSAPQLLRDASKIVWPE